MGNTCEYKPRSEFKGETVYVRIRMCKLQLRICKNAFTERKCREWEFWRNILLHREQLVLYIRVVYMLHYYRYYSTNSSIRCIRDVRDEKPILNLIFLRHVRFLLEISQTLRIQDTSLMMRDFETRRKEGRNKRGRKNYVTALSRKKLNSRRRDRSCVSV